MSRTCKKIDDDFIKLAKDRGFEWLGKQAVGIHEKTMWRCSKGQEWKTSLTVLSESKYGCPYCTNHLPVTIYDYHKIAKKRSLTWLGPLPENSQQPTWWQWKSCNHKWQANFSRIKRGHGCVNCGNKISGEKRRVKTDKYIKLAQERGFEWVGPEVNRTTIKTQWKCQKGHVWKALYNDIYFSKSGCPYCLDLENGFAVSKIQRALHKLLGGELNKIIERYSIVIALDVKHNRIATEYDSWYWHGAKSKHDNTRNRFLLNRGWKILRIKSNRKSPDKEDIYQALEQ